MHLTVQITKYFNYIMYILIKYFNCIMYVYFHVIQF